METTNIAVLENPISGKESRFSQQEELDKALAVLSANKEAWATLDIARRIALLDLVKLGMSKIEDKWLAISTAAKEYRPETFDAAIDCYSLTAIYRYIGFLRKALQDIQLYGNPKIPGKVSVRKNGQVVAKVGPYDWKEAMSLPGIRAEVWMDPSVSSKEDIPQASFYHQKDKKGHICVVLGAGNVASLVPADFMHMMFVEGKVVALKMNPVNEYLGPLFEEAFSALIEAGFLQVLYGGAKEGAYLCNHQAVNSVHITGSVRTFEAVVFGPGDEGQKRKQQRQPQFTKPFTSELGNISPIIVVPGPWSEKDIRFQAKRMGSWMVPNSAHNCLTPRLIVQMKNWEHREKLKKEITDFLDGIKTLKAYYPGSFKLHQEFLEAHPEAMQLGKPKEGHLPWTFIPDVDSAKLDDICFRKEPFMSLFSETSLEASGAADFVGKAVEFVNEKVWGTLNATIMVHPKSMKDPVVAAAVNKAIADLRYGSVVINNWGALAHYMTTTPWGGHPGSNIYDVQSGIGFVNNPLMFDKVQKSVVYTDFSPLADPFIANLSNNYLWLRQDARFQYKRSIGNMFSLIWRAMTLKEDK